MSLEKERVVERFALVAGGVLSFGLFAYLIYSSSQGMSPANDQNSSRILWQLIKGGLASIVLLAGCLFLFNKRAGIVLPHSGVLLIMCNELVVFYLHTEWKMDIPEKGINWSAINLNENGTSRSRTFPISKRENKFQIVSIPLSRLEKSLNSGDVIQDAELPCDVLVTRFYQNSKEILANNSIRTSQRSRFKLRLPACRM